MTARFHLTRRKSGKIFESLMLIRCLSCETGATFVSIVASNLKKLRILRLVRLEFSPETPFGCLITRRSQVQVLSPQPPIPRAAMVLGILFLLSRLSESPVPPLSHVPATSSGWWFRRTTAGRLFIPLSQAGNRLSSSFPPASHQ